MSSIPLSVPSLNGNEWKYVKECIESEWVSSAGKYVDAFEKKISQYTGSKFAIACVNGTSALQVSLKLAGVELDDEVIVPTLTFIAPVNAVAYNGANPVFMDCNKFYNIDTDKIIEFINTQTVFRNGITYNKSTNKRISAIILVHVWGNACWLDELILLFKERNIAIIEDACESLGTFYNSGKYKGCHTGTIGRLGCLSFNGNKIITTGGGGMILTNIEKLADKARYLTTQAKDDPIRYYHDNIGYNFRMSNIQAALGVAQMDQLTGFLVRKRKIFQRYKAASKKIKGLIIANSPNYALNNHWMNLMQIDNEIYGENCASIMERLKDNGIQSRPVWALNHMQKPYKNFQNYKIEKAEELVAKSICLPSSTNLTKNDLNKVITQLNG